MTFMLMRGIIGSDDSRIHICARQPDWSSPTGQRLRRWFSVSASYLPAVRLLHGLAQGGWSKIICCQSANLSVGLFASADWSLGRKIIRTVLCRACTTDVHNDTHTCEQFLNLCWFRFRFRFLCVCLGLVFSCILC